MGMFCCMAAGSLWVHCVWARAASALAWVDVNSPSVTSLGCVNCAAVPLPDLASSRMSSMKYPSVRISSRAEVRKGPAWDRHAVIGGGSVMMAPARGKRRYVEVLGGGGLSG